MKNVFKNEGRYRPGEIWNDDSGNPINAHGGGIIFHEGVYYWFGEHKVAGRLGNTAQVGVHVYVSRDLYNWRDEGVALQVSDDPNSSIARGCILERPKVLFNAKTGKFVMWFHLEPKGAGYTGALSGVAVAEAPAGPYKFIASFRPNAGVWPDNIPVEDRKLLEPEELERLKQLELRGGSCPYYPKHLLYRRDFQGGQMARDMTLFQDDDGYAYHIYSSEENGTLHLSLLSEDYLRPAGRYIRILPGRFNEAPAMMKHQGTYYLFTSGCTGWTPNEARLLAAPNIWGPWEELGNPSDGTPDQVASTFGSQSTFILQIPDKEAFIFMADRWRPQNAIDGRYVWLPISFRHGTPIISWQESWDLVEGENPQLAEALREI